MGARLLLADDSITIQKVVGIIFANEDYDLTVVDNGVSALEKAREQVPDLMLVDALMPGRNGYEVCQEIRGDAALKNVPLLLMIGAFEPFDEDKAHQCGADDVISKPFESQQLLEKVTELLKLGKERGEPQAMVPTPEPTALPELSDAVEPFEEAVAFDSLASPAADVFDEPLATAEFVTPAEIRLSPSETAGFELDIVEAAPGDDPWGVFDLTDMDEELPLVLEEPAAILSETVDDTSSFTEEPPAPPAETEPVFLETSELPEKEPAADLEPSGIRWEPVEEESFRFQGEEPASSGEPFAFGMGEPISVLAQEPDVFAESPSTAIPVAEITPVAGQETPPVAAVPAEPAPTAATVAFGEDQLRAILSQLSREMIEKIVWEVVPDLAENLIREEIRRLKSGMRDQ